MPSACATSAYCHIKELTGLYGIIKRRIKTTTMNNSGLQNPMTRRRRVDLESRRQPPMVTTHVYETLVLEVIVCIGYKYRKDNSPPEFMKVFNRLTGELPNNITDVCVVPVVLAFPVQCGSSRHAGSSRYFSIFRLPERRTNCKVKIRS